MSDEAPLSGEIALVTGATRGIGRAAAVALAQAGAQVVGVGRSQGGLEELDDDIRRVSGRSATLVPLDLTEADGIDQLGLALHNRFGRLDLLVHAAAVLGPLTPVAHLDPKHWDRIVSANLTAAYRLIRGMEPLLRAAPQARAIFLTSGVASRPRAFWGAYGATKAAMEALVRSWADEVETTNIRAAIVDPGKMRTKMRAEAYPAEDPQTLPEPGEIGPLIVELAQAQLGLPERNIVFQEWRAAKS